MIKIIKVTGESLSPFFLPDDFVLVLTMPISFKSISPGDTVVFDHPQFGRLIKTVISNSAEAGFLKVQGANEGSVSSHKLGPIPYTALIGKVILHFSKSRPLF